MNLHRDPAKLSAVCKRRICALVFFTLGTAGIVIMLCTMDVSALNWRAAFRLILLWLPVILLLWLIIYAIHTHAWRIIMGNDGKSIPFLRLFRITIAGFAMNRVTPAGIVGGEPYRIMALESDMGVEKATASSVTFTITQTASHALFWVTGVAVYFALYGLSGSMVRSLLMALLGALCLAVCVLYFFSREHHLALHLFLFFGRIPGLKRPVAKFIEKNEQRLRQIDSEMVAFRQRKRPFILSFLLEYGTWVMEVLEYFLIFRILGADITFAQTLMALSVASALGNLAFFIPMQLGTREGGLALALRWCGIDASVGVSAALFARIREIIFIVLGVALILINEKGAEQKKEP